MIRLDRFLANQGIGTRKEVKQLIRQQLVRIDGVLIERGDHKFDEERCCFTNRPAASVPIMIRCIRPSLIICQPVISDCRPSAGWIRIRPGYC